MHPHDQNVLVVAAVENGNAAPRGQAAVDPPQIIVTQVLLGGDFEAVHSNALGIQPAHDMLDGAVLTRGVQGLQQDDKPLPPVGVQGFLQGFHLFQIVGGPGCKFNFAAAVFPGPGGQTVQITGPGPVKAKSFSIHGVASCGIIKPHHQYTRSKTVSQPHREG